MKGLQLKLVSASLLACLMMVSSLASADAIIDNGTIQLGVDDYGQLNVSGGVGSPEEGETVVGLRYLPTGNEATSHGCLCEGWGVGVGDTGVSGWANNSTGFGNIVVGEAQVSDGTSTTTVADLGTGELRVTHDFAPSPESANLYKVVVTIENTSAADITDVRYRRTFDWDIEPSAFDEYVTIGGTAASAVLASSNDGFTSSNPFSGIGGIDCFGADVTGDFEDVGVCDHGANFDFGFTGGFLGTDGILSVGESMSFNIFYGAALTEADAFGALAAVGAEVYSFGQAEDDPDGDGVAGYGGTNTFIFGFSGVGGTVVSAPEPSAFFLIATGLLGLGLRRRRRAA